MKLRLSRTGTRRSTSTVAHRAIALAAAVALSAGTATAGVAGASQRHAAHAQSPSHAHLTMSPLRTMTVTSFTPAFVQGSSQLDGKITRTIVSFVDQVKHEISLGATLSTIRVIARTDAAGSVSLNEQLGRARAIVVGQKVRAVLGADAHGVSFVLAHKLSNNMAVLTKDRASTVAATLIDPKAMIHVQPFTSAVVGAQYTPVTTATTGTNVIVTVDPSSSAVCTLGNGVISFIGVGTCTLNFNDSGNASHNAATLVQQHITVAKGNAVITPSTTAPSNAMVAGATYSPTATSNSGDSVVISVDPSSSAVCTITEGVVSFTAVGTCTLNFNDAGNANYNAATQVQQSFAVTPGVSIITPTSTVPSNAIVAGTTYFPTGTSTSGDPVVITVDPSSSAVCTISLGTGLVSYIGVGTCTLNFNDAGNANFNAATQVQQSFTVDKGTAVITPSTTAPGNASFGGATYTPAATSTSGDPVVITVDPASVNYCSISNGAVSFIGVGTCTLNFNDAGNANFNAATQVQQSFTVVPGISIISPSTTAPANAQVAGATYAPAATSTSGDPVVITVDPSSSAVCSIVDGVVSFTAVGTCTLNFNDAGNANYNAASQVQQSFTVQKQAAVITPSASAPSNAIFGAPTYQPAATSTSGDPVVITVDPSSSAVCSISAGTGMVVYLGVGTCTLNFDDAGNATYAAAATVQQSFVVGQATSVISPSTSAPSSATIGSGSYTPAATATSGDTVVITIDPSSSAVCSISGGVVSFTAAGTCTVNFNDAGNANYAAAAQVQQSFTVAAQGSLTVLFTPATANQYVWFCGPSASANSGSVCAYPNYSHQINFTGRTSTTPVTWNTTIPTGNYFSITVMAPSTVPPGAIIGPGVGITCIQRGGPNNLVGTVNGVISGDWTGAGAGYRNYWYTGCSFNPGVSSGYFYAQTAVA